MTLNNDKREKILLKILNGKSNFHEKFSDIDGSLSRTACQGRPILNWDKPTWDYSNLQSNVRGYLLTKDW